jgi:hypothetical protein
VTISFSSLALRSNRGSSLKSRPLWCRRSRPVRAPIESLRSHFLAATTYNFTDRIPGANVLVALDGVNTLSLIEEPQSWGADTKVFITHAKAD